MKLITKLLTIISILSITACVPESEHNKVVSERNELAIKNDSLKKELEGIKFGAPNLLSDGKAFYDANEFIKAINAKYGSNLKGVSLYDYRIMFPPVL